MSSRLIDKFNLTLDQLSFEYIGSCSNKTTLERIIRVLRSGEEGLYPDLLKHAEGQLEKVDPTNRLLLEEVHLHKKADISTNDWNDLVNDLKSWEADVKSQEKTILALSTPSSCALPKIRSDFNSGLENPSLNSGSSSKGESSQLEVKPKRKSYDDWNRFDVDEELAKIDTNVGSEEEKESKIKRDMENDKKAEIERERGNEYFKNENFSFALEYYNKSIQLKPSSAAYNNRAITYIKLKKYQAAVNDCNRVLSLDPNNIKALYRRSTAYVGLSDENSLKLGWKDLKLVLSLEPDNRAAQNEINNLVRRYPGLNHGSDNNLPVTFYWPSTSDFKVMPQSSYYYMYARSNLPTNRVPCRCNYAIPQENPLCRRCGEETIRRLKLRAKEKCKSSSNSLSASEILRICQERNTNFYVSPSRSYNTKSKNITAMSSSPKSDTNQANSQLKTTSKLQNNNAMQIENIIDSNGVSDVGCSSKSETQTAIGNNINAELAKKAMERGNASFNAKDYMTALNYYNTSVKLHPQVDCLLKRAEVHLQMKRYQEATQDCVQVLSIDPNNVLAKIRKATASCQLPEEAAFMEGLEDLENIKNVLKDQEINDEFNQLLELILKKKTKLPATTHAKQEEESCLEKRKVDEVNMTNGWSREEGKKETKKKEKKTRKTTPENDGDCHSSITKINETQRNGSLTKGTENSQPEIYKKQNKRNKKKSKKISESKDENDAKNHLELIQNSLINSNKSDCSSNEKIAQNSASNNINHKKTKKMKSASTNAIGETSNASFTNPSTNSIEKAATINCNNVKKIGPSNLDKYFGNMMSKNIVNNGEILTRFSTMWNEFKRCDLQYIYRCKTLQTLTPDLLKLAFKKKFECETLTELVKTIGLLAESSPTSAAEYLSELPKIRRFHLVKQKLEESDIANVNSLIESLEKRNIHLQIETKAAFL